MSNSFYIFLTGLPASQPRMLAVGGYAPSNHSALLTGAPPPHPGFTFGRPKVNRKSASPLRAGLPPFAQSVPIRFDAQLPLKFCRPLAPRNRCGGYPTSPDGPRDEGCFFFVSGSLGGSDNRRQFDIEIRFAYPFKPVGPYPLTPPVADSNEDRATAEAGYATRRRSDAKKADSVA